MERASKTDATVRYNTFSNNTKLYPEKKGIPLLEIYDIAGYCRISVDDELERDNVSIENQKAIIKDFVHSRFPGSTLTFYEDRDRSGYTFDQREGYQSMRKKLISHKYDILVIKDFSRFSRRNSRGLVELEDLRDAGVRIISIVDGIDFPNDDDWLKIQFQFLINEMPVTDTSKKVKAVIKRRQQDGKWICVAPYGYVINRKKEFEVVPEEAEVIRKIFDLYNNAGWGYKRIANHLTEESIPTPRMCERMRLENEGKEPKRRVKTVWSIMSVQAILNNDFYIGTLRQGKTTRSKINGAQMCRPEEEVLVFEKHHPPIIDDRTFTTARALREQRTTSHYRGVKKYDNDYSGLLRCGDCGSPMFSLSRPELPPAYTCGSYHLRGRKGCTSHHIRVEVLDRIVKQYVKLIKENSSDMVPQLEAEIGKTKVDAAETERSKEHLETVLKELQEELRATKRQRIRDVMKHPEREQLLEETYDEMEAELEQRISGIKSQIAMTSETRSTIMKAKRSAKTAAEVFADILQKGKLERNDLQIMINRIFVYEDHLDVSLKPDLDALLQNGNCPKTETANGIGQIIAVPAPAPLQSARTTEKENSKSSVRSRAIV